MPENGTPPTPAADDALARVLQPLLELSFVLTDRDGFVTRWTPRAEAMFGFEGDRVTGHSLLETIGSSVQETPIGGVLDASVHHEQGNEFPVELTFIPVPMSHSLEFNFFLESLESDRPRESVLRRVQSQHSDVLDWISSVVAAKDLVSADDMTAGTIVTFRAKVDTPWSDLAVGSGNGGESRPPRDAGPSPELSGAVARADEMMARSDVLERSVGEATAAVEEARTKADAAHETAAATASRVAQLDDENTVLRNELDGARNDLAELRRALESRSADGVASEAVNALRAELAELQETAATASSDEIATLREELERLRQQDAAAGSEELSALKRELEELRESAQADNGSSEELEELRRELRELRAQAPAGDEIASLKAELEALRTLSSDHERLEHLRAEVAELRAQPPAPDTSQELEELRRELRELRSAPGPDEVDIQGLKEELRALRDSAPGAADSLELEHLKREVEALRSSAPASEELEALRRDLNELRQSARSDDGEQVAALRNELEALKIDASGRVNSIREELDALRESALSKFGESQLAELRAEVEQLITAAPAQGAGGEALKQLREELSTAHARANEVAERMADLESTGGAAGGADPAAVRKAEQALESARALAETMQAQVDAAKAAAADADASRRDADAAKRGAEAADERAEGAAESTRRHLAETREGVESAALEAKLARSQAEAARAAADEAVRYVEAARELAEAMATKAEAEAAEDDGPAPLLGKKDTGPSRPPVPGFDDAGQPMARIELDGKFKELNSGFTELVGYSETDFQAASWPPIADRRQLDHHREQMQAMLDGKFESVDVDTGYVHAQGLLVPVAGTLTLVRDDAGEPSHFLLAVNPPARAAAAA